MKKTLILLSFFTATYSFADTWYWYCIAEMNDVRNCTYPPDIRTQELATKCLGFSEDLGYGGYEIKASTDLERLEFEMKNYCDMYRGPDFGYIYTCQLVVTCPHG